MPSDVGRGTANPALPIVKEHPAIAITLVSVVAYFWTRMMQLMYYGHFGLTPEDVGISVSETISRSALAVGLLLAVNFTVGIGMMIGGAVISPIARRAKQGSIMAKPTVGVIGAVVTLGIAAWFFHSSFSDDSILNFLAGTTWAKAFGVGGLVGLGSPFWSNLAGSQDERFTKLTRRTLVKVGWSFIAVSVLVFFLLTLGLAKGAARAVAGGASVPGQAASLYGFHAREVLVQWVGDANPIDFPEGGSLVLLLGRNGERLQLFDPNLQRVWEIDASDVILSTPIGE